LVGEALPSRAADRSGGRARSAFRLSQSIGRRARPPVLPTCGDSDAERGVGSRGSDGPAIAPKWREVRRFGECGVGSQSAENRPGSVRSFSRGRGKARIVEAIAGTTLQHVAQQGVGASSQWHGTTACRPCISWRLELARSISAMPSAFSFDAPGCRRLRRPPPCARCRAHRANLCRAFRI
jgi:hypothetical protein